MNRTQLQSTNTLQFGLDYNSQHNMPGNSDKSSEKPKLAQTVQTLLAAKNGNEKQKKKTPKSPNIEVSMDSSSDLTIELTNFQNDLDIIKDSLEGVVKKKQIFTNLLMTL